MGRGRNPRASFGERQLNLTLWNIREKFGDAMIKGTKRALEDFAPQLLEETVEQEAAFNNYLGNLEGSYVAVVISNGVRRKIFYHEPETCGRIVTGKKGGRKVFLSKKRHGLKRWVMNPKWQPRFKRAGYYKTPTGRIVYREMERHGYHKYIRSKNEDEPRPYRYIKKGEKISGYRHMIWKNRASKYQIGRKKSFIRIMNIAPYAPYVQYAKGRTVHYNVLRGPLMNRFGQMYKDVLLSELKERGFRAKIK